MAKRKTFTDYERFYHRSELKQLLLEFDSGAKHYTSSLGRKISSLRGKANAPLLRKALRTMEQDGYVINIDLGCNIHQWQITPAGEQYRDFLKHTEFSHYGQKQP